MRQDETPQQASYEDRPQAPALWDLYDDMTVIKKGKVVVADAKSRPTLGSPRRTSPRQRAEARGLARVRRPRRHACEAGYGRAGTRPQVYNQLYSEGNRTTVLIPNMIEVEPWAG